MGDAIDDDARAFLAAWFDTRRVVQSLNFNRFQQEGLSASQFILLNMIAEAGAGAAPADLARRLNVDVTTTMRTGNSLAARGLLEKAADPRDGRRTILTLTHAGRMLHARMEAAFVAQVTGAFAAMPARLRSGLIEGLRAFVAASGPATPVSSPPR